MLHEVKFLDLILLEIKRILKNNGKLAIIEWKVIKQNQSGPPARRRIEPENLVSKLRDKNFKNIKSTDISEKFYAIEAYV